MAAMSGGGNPWCSTQEVTSEAELTGSDSGEGRRGRERSRCGGNGAPVAWPLRARLKELGRVSSMALLLWHKRGRERLEKGETRRRGGQEERAGGLAWWMRAMPWWMRSPAATGLTRSRAVAAGDFWWRGNHGRWSEALVGGRWIGMDGGWLGEEAEEETRWACSSGHNGQRGHPRIRVWLIYR